jgi:hypothetical protein
MLLEWPQQLYVIALVHFITIVVLFARGKMEDRPLKDWILALAFGFFYTIPAGLFKGNTK